MTTILRALIEEWPGETGIYIAELPGLFVSAADSGAVLERLPDAVEAHLAWLASHGFATGDGPIEIDVAEQLPAVDGRDGPLFVADREAATPATIQHALQVAALARRDLIDLYRSVSEVRRERQPGGGEWSMAQHLHHIAQAEIYYLGPFPWSSDVELPSDPVRALQASARAVEAVLGTVPDEHRQTVFVQGSEQWSVSKALRRMTGHLGEHFPWLRELAGR